MKSVSGLLNALGRDWSKRGENDLKRIEETLRECILADRSKIAMTLATNGHKEAAVWLLENADQI